MKEWLCIGVLGLGLAACGGNVVAQPTGTQSTTGAGNSAGDGGAGNSAGNGGAGNSAGNGGAGNGGSAGAGADCGALLAEAAQPVTIHVENNTNAPIYIYDECYIGGPDGIRIDEHPVLESWFNYSCDELLACQELALDCFGGQDVEIPAGTAFTATWTGHFLAEESATVPAGCLDNCVFSSFTFCSRKLAAKPGPHTLQVEYATAQKGQYTFVKVPFELPAAEVTVTIP